MKLSAALRLARRRRGRVVRKGKADRRNMVQRLRRAPERPEPGQRGRGRPGRQPEHVSGHRDQRLQVERAGQAVADTGDGEVMPARHGGARLIGEGFGGGSSPILTTK